MGRICVIKAGNDRRDTWPQVSMQRKLPPFLVVIISY